MQKLHKLIELHISGQSQRSMASITGLHRSTVATYITLLYKYAGEDFSCLLSFTEEELWVLVTIEESTTIKEKLFELFPTYEKRLAKVGVNKRFLWEEYCLSQKDTLSYSRFCYYFKAWEGTKKLTMRMEHKAGDKLFVDFAGNKLYLTDKETNKKTPIELFIAVLGYSQMTYCQAVYSQKKGDFLNALSSSLTFFGGVPQAIVPDNLKSAVSKADRYEPDLNESMADFGEHYQTTIYPTRSYRPKDKALVERTVGMLYTRIYAPLEGRIFYSLSALNEAIRELLLVHNQLLFQGKTDSRQQRYEETERQMLQELPSTRYELKSFRLAKVHPDCHVKLSEDKHYYSVPYKFVGQLVKLRYSTDIVEIYHQYQRIAIHQRFIAKGGYTTIKEHLHPTHQWVASWSSEFFIQQAEKIGKNTTKTVEQILLSRKYPEQAYKTCAGLLALAKKQEIGALRLENACERALAYEFISLKLVNNILERGLDKAPFMQAEQPFIPHHNNIRGAEYYQ